MVAIPSPKCKHCGKVVRQSRCAINKALRDGLPLYCNRKCFGLARRADKTKKQRKAEKRLYDIEYRRKNRALLKAQKAAAFKATYDPAKAAIVRKARMPYHVEYCRQPEYKAWKSKYDRRYKADKHFAEFGEAYLLLRDIEQEIEDRATKYEIRIQNGTLNKSKQRKRDYEKTTGIKIDRIRT